MLKMWWEVLKLFLLRVVVDTWEEKPPCPIDLPQLMREGVIDDCVEDAAINFNPLVTRGGKKIRLTKALSRAGRLDLLALYGEYRPVQGRLEMFISSREEDLARATTEFRSCLSPGKCNDWSLQSYLDCGFMVAVVVDHRGRWMGRLWLIPSRWGGFRPAPYWYGNAMDLWTKCLEEYLKAQGLWAEELELPIEFDGWLDGFGKVDPYYQDNNTPAPWVWGPIGGLSSALENTRIKLLRAPQVPGPQDGWEDDFLLVGEEVV